MIKNVLLTNIYISQYSGSEIDTLQTAKWFAKNGATVEIATLHKSNPLLAIFEEQHIKVTSVLTEELSRKEYDLLWGHHWPIINHLLFKNLAAFRKLIHYSLGALEPLECALSYHSALPLCFAISQEVRDNLIKLDGVDPDKIMVFPNAVEDAYFENCKPGVAPFLKKIGVISNHLPPELSQLRELLAPKGIDVDYIGLQNRYEFVTVDTLLGYDLIITIGRTVQQCFAAKVPVYCYDVFGGPGYITQKNRSVAGYFNFSGRGFDRKLTGVELADDLLLQYADSLKNIDFLQESALQNYRFETNMGKMLELISGSPDLDQSAVIANHLQFQRINEAYIRDWNRMRHLDAENQAHIKAYQSEKASVIHLEADILALNQAREHLEAQIQVLKQAHVQEKERTLLLESQNHALKEACESACTQKLLLEKENSTLNSNYNQMQSSRSYALAKKIARFYSFAKRTLSFRGK